MPYKEFVNLSKEWNHRNQIYSDAQNIVDQEELSLLKDGIDPKSLQELSNLNPADFSNYRQKEEEVKQLDQEYDHIQQQLDQLESKTWAKRGIKNFFSDKTVSEKYQRVVDVSKNLVRRGIRYLCKQIAYFQVRKELKHPENIDVRIKSWKVASSTK